MPFNFVFRLHNIHCSLYLSIVVTVYFVQSTYNVQEDDGNVTITIKKEGDNEIQLSAILNTQEGTATGMLAFHADN